MLGYAAPAVDEIANRKTIFVGRPQAPIPPKTGRKRAAFLLLPHGPDPALPALAPPTNLRIVTP